jgi:hypothetical protein
MGCMNSDALLAATTAKLDALFSNFNKCRTYSAAFKMMDDGQCRLLDIQDAASAIGIKPSVIASRRHEHVRSLTECYTGA